MFTVDWSKYPLTQKDWEFFATLDPEKERSGKRNKWLKERGIQYPKVPICKGCNKVFFHCMCDDSSFKTKEEREKYRVKKANWQAELAKSFEEKLKHSEELIQRVLEMARKDNLKFVLAYSGGFDSDNCLELCKEGIKEKLITPIIGNTITELPDTQERWKEAEADLSVPFIRATPKIGVTFKSNAIKNGLPIYPRNSGAEKDRRPTKLCCRNLKENPQFEKQKDFNGVIMGLKATEESRGRQWTIKRNGDCFLGKNGKWHIYPIAYWTIEDEWKFQQLRGFKYNKIYDKTNCGIKGKYKLQSEKFLMIRSGCAFCAQSIHSGYLEWLQEYYPKTYNALIKVYNEVAQARGDGMNFLQVLLLKKKQMLKDKEPCGEPLRLSMVKTEKPL